MCAIIVLYEIVVLINRIVIFLDPNVCKVLIQWIVNSHYKLNNTFLESNV
jgi:hypothetical protein